jgi:hypothetical protein
MILRSSWTLRPQYGYLHNFVLAALVLVVIGLNLISLRFLQSPFMDEPIMVSRAWGWLQTGLNYGALDAGVLEKKFDGYWTFHPLIPTWLHALFIQIFGLDLGGVRLASLVCGIALSMAVFSLSYQFSNSYRAGFIAVLLLVSSYSFALSARIVRYDVIVAMFGFAAISVFWAGSNRGSFGLGFISGVLLGLAFETHVNGAVYGPVLAALIFARWGIRFYKEHAFWGFAAGFFAILFAYLYIHVIRYPDTYFGMGRAFAGTHYPPLIQGSALTVINAFVEMGTFILIMMQLTVISMIIAAIMLWRDREGTIPLLVALVGAISFTLLIKAKNFYYFIMIAPFLYIVIAGWLEHSLCRLRSLSSFGKFSTALGISLLLVNAVVVLVATFRNAPPSTDDAKVVAHHIERHLPAGGSLIGMQFYWFDLYRYKYISWQQIVAYRLYEPNSTFDDAMTALKPDLFVIDDHLRDYIFTDTNHPPSFGFDRYRWERRLNKFDIDTFLSRRATLVDRVQTHGLGNVEIYKIDWAEQAITASSS